MNLEAKEVEELATTVNNAFAEFMRDIVNLDPDVVSEARTSRDNLLDNIAEFDDKDGFFDLSLTNCTRKSVSVPMEKASSIKNQLQAQRWEISLFFGLSRTAL